MICENSRIYAGTESGLALKTTPGDGHAMRRTASQPALLAKCTEVT